MSNFKVGDIVFIKPRDRYTTKWDNRAAKVSEIWKEHYKIVFLDNCDWLWFPQSNPTLLLFEAYKSGVGQELLKEVRLD